MLQIIWFALLSWRLVNSFSNGNHSIFLDFRDKLNIDTFILYDIGYQDALIENLPQEVKDYPHVLITAEIQWKLKDYFAQPILSVVQVSSLFSKRVLNVVKRSLTHWNLEYVLFITAESLEPPSKWLPLFEWCHNNGFLHSLITNFKHSSLLTYDHFETHQVFHTNLTAFLDYHRYLHDLHGFPILAALGNNPPRAMVWNDTNGNRQMTGYYVQTLIYFAAVYNASLEFMLLSNMTYYSELDCLKRIMRAEVDVCADAMLMDPAYLITDTEEMTQSYLVVPYDKPVERFHYFVKPFRNEVWHLIIGSFLYNMLTLSFIHRLQRKSWNLSRNFLSALLSLLNLPFDLNWLESWHRRLIEMMMMVVGFVAANWYLSILSSLLFTRIYSGFINSLEDLAKHNISIMVSEYEQYALNTSDIYPIISHLLMVVDREMLQHNRRNLVPKYAYYSQEDTNEFYLYQQKRMLHPRMKGLTNMPLNSVFGGIPMRDNWLLEEKLRHHMSHMYESALAMIRPNNAAEAAIKMGYLRYFPTESNNVEPLSLEYFEMPAILLLSGYVMALASFLIEILINRLWPQ